MPGGQYYISYTKLILCFQDFMLGDKISDIKLNSWIDVVWTFFLVNLAMPRGQYYIFYTKLILCFQDFTLGDRIIDTNWSGVLKYSHLAIEFLIQTLNFRPGVVWTFVYVNLVMPGGQYYIFSTKLILCFQYFTLGDRFFDINVKFADRISLNFLLG